MSLNALVPDDKKKLLSLSYATEDLTLVVTRQAKYLLWALELKTEKTKELTNAQQRLEVVEASIAVRARDEGHKPEAKILDMVTVDANVIALRGEVSKLRYEEEQLKNLVTAWQARGKALELSQPLHAAMVRAK